MQKEIKSNNQLKTLLFLQLELQGLEKVYSVFSDLLFIFTKYSFLFETSSPEPSSIKPTHTKFETLCSTQDPARDGGNWWAYCQNNPLIYTDPTGLFYYEGTSQKRSLYLEAKSTTVVILRKDDGTGNSFNSERYIYKDYGFGKHIVFHDMVGANCKEENVSDEDFTEPDGEYYYSVDKLTKQADGTYDSGSYENTLQVKTNDPNIPENVRNKINNAKQPFLDHANQQSKKNKGIYGNNERVEGAGCVIGKDGQEQQDKYMAALLDGVKEIRSIKRIIHSYSNGTLD